MAENTNNPRELATTISSSDDLTASQTVTTNTEKSLSSRTFTSKCLDLIALTPPWCRLDPTKPPEFSLFQNVLFAFAGAFTVANLYYNHPILNILADDFNVSYLEVSRIPTLMQGGYATGLLLICPLGDLFPRRPYTLILVFFTATLWIVLCVTNSFKVFCAISFITSITTVTPQIMLPLVGELAPAKRRPLALSIVVSGNLLGIVIARILSGVVTNFTSWRNIYWIALGLQYSIFVMLWLFMPSYPASNPTPNFKQFGTAYPKLLFSILQLCVKYPVLVQAGATSFCISGAFTDFWTTLTFLLSGAPYHLQPTEVGLFGLIGVAGIILGPIYAKYIIQPLKIPLYAVFVGATITLIGCTIGSYTGGITLAGPIIQALCLDAGFQITQIANRSAIYAVEPTGRNRVNTAFMVLTFLGQLTGTSAGNKIYERAGWKGSGSLGVGLVGLAIILNTARGPWEEGWVGWHGGWGRTKKGSEKGEKEKPDVEQGDRAEDESGNPTAGSPEADSLHPPRYALTREQSYGSDGHTTYGDDTYTTKK